MPQLDVSTYASQLFWLVLTFVPLYLIIVRVALPRIGEVLEARQDKIDDDLKKAAARKEEADSVLAEYEALQADSQAKAQALLRQAQEEMAAEAARLNDELTSRLVEEGAVAEKRIAAAKADAISNLSAAVTEVASVATKKLIGATPSEAEVRNALAAVTGKRD